MKLGGYVGGHVISTQFDKQQNCMKHIWIMAIELLPIWQINGAFSITGCFRSKSLHQPIWCHFGHSKLDDESPRRMLISGLFIGVSLHRRKRDLRSGAAEVKAVEDGCGGPGAATQTRTSNGCLNEDYGSVPGRWYYVRSMGWKN